MNIVFGPFYSRARCDAKARGQLLRLCRASSVAREIWDFGQFRAISLYSNEGFGDGLGACGDGGLMYKVTRGMSNGAVCRGDKSRGIL